MASVWQRGVILDTDRIRESLGESAENSSLCLVPTKFWFGRFVAWMGLGMWPFSKYSRWFGSSCLTNSATGPHSRLPALLSVHSNQGNPLRMEIGPRWFRIVLHVWFLLRGHTIRLLWISKLLTCGSFLTPAHLATGLSFKTQTTKCVPAFACCTWSENWGHLKTMSTLLEDGKPADLWVKCPVQRDGQTLELMEGWGLSLLFQLRLV